MDNKVLNKTSKLLRDRNLEMFNKAVNNKIKNVAWSSGYNHIQINHFNNSIVALKKNNKVDVHIAYIDAYDKENNIEYAAILVLYTEAGKNAPTEDQWKMMFSFTQAEHDWVEYKADNLFIDKNGLVITDYNIDKACIVEDNK